MDTNIQMQPHYMRCSGGLYVVSVRDASQPLFSMAGQWYPVGDSGPLANIKHEIENNRDEMIRLFVAKRASRTGRS